MEPAKKHKNTDFSIAYPVPHKTLGVAWVISGTSYMSRREVSDDGLNLFEEINKHFNS
jgi:hypothetical protein